jgi:hypothetical protein
MIIKAYIRINLDEMMSDSDHENNWGFIDSKVEEKYGSEVLQEKILGDYKLETLDKSLKNMVWSFKIDRKFLYDDKFVMKK